MTALEHRAKACAEHLRNLSTKATVALPEIVELRSVGPKPGHGWALRYRTSIDDTEIEVVAEPDASRAVARSPWLGFWHAPVNGGSAEADERLNRAAAQLCAALAAHDTNEPPTELAALVAPAIGDRFNTDAQLLELPGDCGRGCVFCATPHLRPGGVTSGWLARRRARNTIARIRPGRPLLLTGNDCLQSPLLDEALAEAARRGVSSIGVQTPGTRLRDAAFVDRLVEQGLALAALTAHGATAATFDACAGYEGAYECFWAGMENLVTRGVAVTVEVPMVRCNAHELVALLERLSPLPVQVSCFFWYPDPEFPRSFESVTDDYAAYVRLLDDARARVARERVSVAGIPACAAHPVLREHYTWSYPSHHSRVQRPQRVPQCNGCTFADSCPGIAEVYLGAYGDPALRQ